MSKPNDNGGPASEAALRDYFAGQALAAMRCADLPLMSSKLANRDAREIAYAAYLIADAMIEARGKE